MRRAKKEPDCKPNVIPILDAVFIFIFFLLMSAQFIDIYEIGSDAPSISTLTKKQEDKKKPLNLIFEIHKNQLVVKTGLNEVVKSKISLKNKDIDSKKLQAVLISLKSKFFDESSVIFRPDKNVSYEKIIQIIDITKNIQEKGKVVKGKLPSGQDVETSRLFDQIIFET